MGSQRYLTDFTMRTDAFPDKEGFVKWYNEIRPHLSLRFDLLETLAQGFERKKRKEEGGVKVKNEKAIEVIEGK